MEPRDINSLYPPTLESIMGKRLNNLSGRRLCMGDERVEDIMRHIKFEESIKKHNDTFCYSYTGNENITSKYKKYMDKYLNFEESIEMHNKRYNDVYNSCKSNEDRAARYIREDARGFKQLVMEDLDKMIDKLPVSKELQEADIKTGGLDEAFELNIKKATDKITFYVSLIESLEGLETVEGLKNEYLENLRTELATQHDILDTNNRLYSYWKALNNKN